MPFLTLKNVNRGFGRPGPDREEVLRDINLEIDEGEFVAIVGFSGAGKSTLINLIAGLVAPETGEIILNGEPLRGPGPDRGVVFQNYSLLPWLTVAGNIALGVDRVFADRSRRERRELVETYIGMVKLNHARDKYPSELSGGMRQRVSLARTLAMNPGILLMDEPLGALDALTRATLQSEIERIWSRDRKTAVLITNDVDEGILLADRIVPLTAGPRATLGPSIPVPLERPRDRKELNHNEDFKRIRLEVNRFLNHSGRRTATDADRRSRELPDLQPQDLSVRPSLTWKWPEKVATRIKRARSKAARTGARQIIQTDTDHEHIS